MNIKINVSGDKELCRLVVNRALALQYEPQGGLDYYYEAKYIFLYDNDMSMTCSASENWYRCNQNEEIHPAYWLTSVFFQYRKGKKVKQDNAIVITSQGGGNWEDGETCCRKGCQGIISREHINNVFLSCSICGWIRVNNVFLSCSICGWIRDQIFYKQEFDGLVSRPETTIRVSKHLFTDFGKPLILPPKVEHKINPLVLPDYEPDYQGILNFKEEMED